MGLQPIDLQVMYSQSNNVSRVAGQQQAAQLSDAMQQSKIVQQNIENASRVHETSNEQSKSNAVSDNGGGNGANPYGGKQSGKKHEENETNEEATHKFMAKPAYLGRIIDITR